MGTFRILSEASFGQFNYVVMMDYDKAAVEFNQRQIEVLKQSKDIVDFLAKLAKVEPQKIKDILQGKMSAEKLLDGYYSWEIPYVVRLIELSDVDPGVSFLTNPTAFEKIKKLALQNRIISIAGDLAGEKTLRQLSHFLNENNITVSVLDISNAPDYVFQAKQGRAYLKNLQQIPWSKGALVNFTAQTGVTSVKDIRALVQLHEGPQWLYFSMPARQYIAEADSFIDSKFPLSRSGYGDFVNGLLNSAADLNNVQIKACEDIFSRF